MRGSGRLLAVVVACALAAGACGDDDEAATTDDAGTSTTTTAASGGDDGGDDGGDGATEGEAVDPAEIEFDHGVTEDTIRIGMLADLSGLFAPTVVEVVEAQQVYWEMVNDNGGIAGRQVELVVLDNGYDVPRQLELYQRLRQEGPEGVAIISQSTGSPHSSAIAQDLIADDMIAIPLSWYSGMADPEFGANLAETYTNYCVESMNIISFMHDKLQEEGKETRLAIISFPGEYGQDGATGAKMAAEALGIEVVYDGEGQVVPGADQTPVISELVNADPTLVFASVNPTAMVEIFGGVRAQGLEAYWAGNVPTFNFQLLATDIAADLSEYFWASGYTANWGAEVEGMEEVVAEFAERRPEAVTSDVWIYGWTEAMLTHQLLEYAASRGDLTRAGIVEAFKDPGFVADFAGLAPEQTWAGDPDDYIVRESYMFDVDAQAFDRLPQGEGVGSSGLVLAEGPFTSDVAADYQWDGPCFAPQG